MAIGYLEYLLWPYLLWLYSPKAHLPPRLLGQVGAHRGAQLGGRGGQLRVLRLGR